VEVRRWTAGGQCPPRAAGQGGPELRRVGATGRYRTVDQVLLAVHVLDAEHEHRRRIGRIKTGDVLEQVVLARAVGVASGAGLTVGCGAVTANVLAPPPVREAIAD